MTDREDIEMLAAEYVLGTLESEERTAVAARRLREPALDAAISAWEQRFSPLLESVRGAEPRSDLLPEIQRRITRSPRAPGLTPAAGEVAFLKKRISRWRAAALGACAVAASLIGFIVVREFVLPPQDQRFVAVFQKDDEPPSFLLSVDLQTRQLTIRPIAAESHPGKTYQLWIVSDKLGPGPQSLGLLDTPARPTRKLLPKLDSRALEAATFGISLEPEGGSPTGKPTGPALHGKLIPTAL